MNIGIYINQLDEFLIEKLIGNLKYNSFLCSFFSCFGFSKNKAPPILSFDFRAIAMSVPSMAECYSHIIVVLHCFGFYYLIYFVLC